jgi:hypothetical protein
MLFVYNIQFCIQYTNLPHLDPFRRDAFCIQYTVLYTIYKLASLDIFRDDAMHFVYNIQTTLPGFPRRRCFLYTIAKLGSLDAFRAARCFLYTKYKPRRKPQLRSTWR